MQKKLLLIFIMMATWIVVGCTPTGTGCYGYWEKKRDGLDKPLLHAADGGSHDGSDVVMTDAATVASTTEHHA